MVTKEDPDIEVWSNLIDTHIDICSSDILEVFEENFDFKQIREEFIKDYIIQQSELHGNEITPHILSGSEYAMRICNLRDYETACKDVIARFLFCFFFLLILA